MRLKTGPGFSYLFISPLVNKGVNQYKTEKDLGDKKEHKKCNCHNAGYKVWNKRKTSFIIDFSENVIPDKALG